MWFDEFMKEAKEINQQLNYLKVACEQSEATCEQMKKDAEYLAQTTPMSNSEALGYVMDKLKVEQYENKIREKLNKLKENDNMFDVSNIKIGDYVKTRDSYVGYVTDLSDNLFLFRYYTEENGLIGVCTGSNLSSVFKQIGTYKFDEVEKKTQNYIREMDESLLSKSEFYNGVDRAIVRKINEIIDKLNKE